MSNITVLRPVKSETPSIVNGNVPPKRRSNKELRPREYLTADEVDELAKAARNTGRHGHRDQTLILIAYRHGLRVSELISQRWDMVDLKQGLIHVCRLKNGVDSVHPLRGPEIRALRKLKKAYPASPYLFVTERGGPITSSTVRKMITRAGQRAGFEFSIHPHMLRHSTGYKLANDGQDTRAIQHYMGHKNIQHTVRYTELSSNRFNGFWTD